VEKGKDCIHLILIEKDFIECLICGFYIPGAIGNTKINDTPFCC
jgi:hypothetical protein